jgi:hypothetical protein
VYVEDHTSSAWPVTQAVRVWDTSPAVVVRYGACQLHTRCVKVREGKPGDDYAGRTYERRDHGHVYADVVVDQELSTVFTGNERLAVVTHEIGHGLGLEHVNKRGQTIMYPDVQETGPYAPTALDFANLAKLYKNMPP